MQLELYSPTCMSSSALCLLMEAHARHLLPLRKHPLVSESLLLLGSLRYLPVPNRIFKSLRNNLSSQLLTHPLAKIPS